MPEIDGRIDGNQPLCPTCCGPLSWQPKGLYCVECGRYFGGQSVGQGGRAGTSVSARLAILFFPLVGLLGTECMHVFTRRGKAFDLVALVTLGVLSAIPFLVALGLSATAPARWPAARSVGLAIGGTFGALGVTLYAFLPAVLDGSKLIQLEATQIGLFGTGAALVCGTIGLLLGMIGEKPNY